MAEIPLKNEELIGGFPARATVYDQGLLWADIELSYDLLQFNVALQEAAVILGHQAPPGKAQSAGNMAELWPEPSLGIDIGRAGIKDHNSVLVFHFQKLIIGHKVFPLEVLGFVSGQTMSK